MELIYTLYVPIVYYLFIYLFDIMYLFIYL